MSSLYKFKHQNTTICFNRLIFFKGSLFFSHFFTTKSASSPRRTRGVAVGSLSGIIKRIYIILSLLYHPKKKPLKPLIRRCLKHFDVVNFVKISFEWYRGSWFLYNRYKALRFNCCVRLFGSYPTFSRYWVNV